MFNLVCHSHSFAITGKSTKILLRKSYPFASLSASAAGFDLNSRKYSIILSKFFSPSPLAKYCGPSTK